MKVRVLSVLSILIIELLLLTGCSNIGTTEENFLQIKKEQLIEQGNSQDLIDGYIHGCTSGKSVVGSTNYTTEKDLLRYNQSHDYSLGWERGYYECRDASIDKLQRKVHQQYIPAEDPVEEMERMKIWGELEK